MNNAPVKEAVAAPDEETPLVSTKPSKGKRSSISDWWSKADEMKSDVPKVAITTKKPKADAPVLLHQSQWDVRVRKSCLHLFFDCVSSVTALSALCMGLSQVLPVFFVDEGDIGPVQMALRVYMTLFCVGVIVAELECLLINRMPLLHSWLVRGIVYSFLGVVGMEESVAVKFDLNNDDDSSVPTTREGHASLFIKLSSYAMTALGVLYFLMGCLCMKRLRDNCRTKYNERIRKAEMKHQILQENLLKEEGLL
eukprot:CAMPEP_0196812618 /NCGR_PEP_ID=MMETSP1362-20130617/29053_1 /TAXON_ID=163516 /ORGANISM="Leptocylindrus danicus, Strain CCMP1856" /LENGTH=252 /DNA_ID=CAMNT_0042188401 /DNA_START=187 /DNA_END=945 /DNA_ORIENTATION=-